MISVNALDKDKSAEFQWMKDCLTESGLIHDKDGVLCRRMEIQDESGKQIEHRYDPIKDDLVSPMSLLYGQHIRSNRERIAELERRCEKPSLSLPWKPGNSRTDFCNGERFFVALRVGTGEGMKRREWWEFFVIQASYDDFTPLHFTSEPEDWGWEWEDVEWYVELDDLISTLPPDDVPGDGG